MWKEELKVKCPRCGKIYIGTWSDGYLYYHDCPGCGYDYFVQERDEVDCPED